mmetsp:Transcript_16936/g.46645  ORF Transcript_16936/g.46645 Transcript_16936/m.46645 type:complete len:263 (-) Transcript_16936:403-1191(-)
MAMGGYGWSLGLKARGCWLCRHSVCSICGMGSKARPVCLWLRLRRVLGQPRCQCLQARITLPDFRGASVSAPWCSVSLLKSVGTRHWRGGSCLKVALMLTLHWSLHGGLASWTLLIARAMWLGSSLWAPVRSILKLGLGSTRPLVLPHLRKRRPWMMLTMRTLQWERSQHGQGSQHLNPHPRPSALSALFQELSAQQAALAWAGPFLVELCRCCCCSRSCSRHRTGQSPCAFGRWSGLCSADCRMLRSSWWRSTLYESLRRH